VAAGELQAAEVGAMVTAEVKVAAEEPVDHQA
jgi:hypothetical protein